MKKRFGLVAAGLLALTMAGCSTQIEKGTSLLKEEKYEEAAEVFEKASGKSSMEREAYRGLGISYFELGQYDKAASAFETALEKGVKKTPELYNLLGISYMKIGQYDKAAVSFENGSQMDGAGDQLKEKWRTMRSSSWKKREIIQRQRRGQTPIFRRGRMMKM